MSDFTGSRFDKKEEVQILLTKSDPIESQSPQHKNYLWTARWTKASSSAEPQNDSSCNRLEDLNKGSGKNDSGILASEFMKSTVAERLMVGVNKGSASVQHSHRFRRTKAVVSETYCLRKLSEVPLDLHELGSSDCNHFPMFEINRKINNVLNPRRRSALAPVSLDVNIAHEYMVHSRRIIEDVDICKPAGGNASNPEAPAGLSSDPSGQKLKGRLSNTMSCSCSQDNDPSNCQINEQHASHYVANSKHELPSVSSGKKFHFAGNEMDQSDASALHDQKSRRSDGYKQQEAVGDIFRAPVLGTEFQKEPATCSYKNKNGGENFDGKFKSHGKAISSLAYNQQHLKTQRTESAANLNLPHPGANTLTVTSKQWTHGKEGTQKSCGPYKPKGLCLYEMLTTAPKSQSACPKNSVSSGNGVDVCMYGTNIGSHLFGTQNQSSARTETLYSDTLVLSKSSAGFISSPAQKDYNYSSDAKTEHLATPSTGRDSDSKEKESHNVNDHDVSSKATVASKQSSMPATGTTNFDLMLFQMSRMRNPISVGVVEPPISAEPSDRWLKRLHLDLLDHEAPPSSKRPKVGGNPSHEDSSCLFGMKEDKESDEGIELHDEDQRWHVPAKSLNYWVGRWCVGGTPVFLGDSGRRRQGTKSDHQASEEPGGQFPSIAAMAMMGRVMNKRRPCEYQKKGPFVVWKTE